MSGRDFFLGISAHLKVLVPSVPSLVFMLCIMLCCLFMLLSCFWERPCEAQTICEGQCLYLK